MKITLEFPNPIFNMEDVVQWGPGNLILHIVAVELSGKWSHLNGESDFWAEGDFRYHTVVQSGKGPEGDLIRPGTTVSFPQTGSADHQLRDAVLVTWDQPIVEPDTLQNIAEREDAWDELKKSRVPPALA